MNESTEQIKDNEVLYPPYRSTASKPMPRSGEAAPHRNGEDDVSTHYKKDKNIIEETSEEDWDSKMLHQDPDIYNNGINHSSFGVSKSSFRTGGFGKTDHIRIENLTPIDLGIPAFPHPETGIDNRKNFRFNPGLRWLPRQSF